MKNSPICRSWRALFVNEVDLRAKAKRAPEFHQQLFLAQAALVAQRVGFRHEGHCEFCLAREKQKAAA
jgi:hypothetical protein